MKVVVFPADAYGCGHYRLVWPADVLRGQGHDVRISPPGKDSGLQAKTETRTSDGAQRLVDVRIPEGVDVLVFQRPAHPLQPQMIQLVRSRGVAVVVDMDDDMSAIDPDNVAFHTYRPQSNTPYSWKHAAESCRAATMVTTSTRALQRIYATPGRGAVLDNYVPERCLEYDKPITGYWGWAGTTQSHPNDLQVSGRASQRLIDEGHPFRVVGGESNVRAAARLDEEPEYTGTVGLESWVRTIGETYDVGMVPLAPTAFNAAKSRLKGIEHLAAGVPYVYSPREEYRRLNRESGCGLPADNPKDWYSQLKRLLTDDVLRKEQAEMGKEYMKDQTYQANAWRWLEAWERAMELERGHGGR